RMSQGDGEFVLSLSKFGTAFNCAPVMGNRILRVSRAAQNIGKITVSVGIVGIERESRFELFDSLRSLTCPREREPKAVAGLIVIRLLSNGVLKVFNRFRYAAGLHERDPNVVKKEGVFWLLCQSQLQFLDSLR